MKLQPDNPTGINLIQSVDATRIVINGQAYAQSLVLPYQGEIAPWAAPAQPFSSDVPPLRYGDLTSHHFDWLAQQGPEIVLFGSGEQLIFPQPQWLQTLMSRRIGLETMTTIAACRTYNILAGEGRRVWAALLLA